MKVKSQWRKHRALLTAILENMMTFGKAGIIKVLLALDILIVLAALLLERKQYSKKNISLVSDICLYPDSYSVPWLCYWYLVSAESGDFLFIHDYFCKSYDTGFGSVAGCKKRIVDFRIQSEPRYHDGVME